MKQLCLSIFVPCAYWQTQAYMSAKLRNKQAAWIRSPECCPKQQLAKVPITSNRTNCYNPHLRFTRGSQLVSSRIKSLFIRGIKENYAGGLYASFPFILRFETQYI